MDLKLHMAKRCFASMLYLSERSQKFKFMKTVELINGKTFPLLQNRKGYSSLTDVSEKLDFSKLIYYCELKMEFH